MATGSNNKSFFYRLTIGDIIASKGEQPKNLILDQGVQKEFSGDSNKKYSLMLHGIKVNRKIYQPTEIEAELDFMRVTTNSSNKEVSSAPQFDDISQLLLQRMVTLEVVVDNSSYEVAKNCYVYEVIPQLKRDADGTRKMYVKLRIFSMDKLMTLNKYSKAYVAHKFGSGILKLESLNFGTVSEGVPLIETDVKSQQNLMYTEADHRLEFIQPYLVQYNESFYDFLVRTSNRCGEFLYFENGKLVLGLPDDDPLKEIENFETVTALERSVDPLMISGYARDSVKDGIGAVKGSDDNKKDSRGSLNLNISAIAREDTGFPSDVFPTFSSSNTELAQDDYIFPLYKDMFTNRDRELNYDGNTGQKALGRMMLLGKTLLANELPTYVGAVATAFIEGVINEGIPTMLADLRVKSFNAAQNQRYIEILNKNSEQYNEKKAVQFGTLNTDGWTTLNYYQDIHLHEEAQQRKIVCINMGTNFVNVKLGQKIKISGLDDVYVIIQIQQNSEEAWDRNYDRYGMEADDKCTGMRSLKIYAIPGYGDDKNQFIPPVHPVPVIRKVGPQTAFVTDNEDPKFQGRVRIAFPWQSLKGPERSELKEVSIKLHEQEVAIEALGRKERMHLEEATKASQFVEELKRYVGATKEERIEQLKSRNKRIEELDKEIKDSEKSKTDTDKGIKDSEKSKTDTDKEIKDSKKSKTDTDNEDKEARLKKMKEEIAEFEAAAKEHDEKKGKAGYKDLEKDNTVICKYKEIYNKENKSYNKAKADLKKVGDKKNENEKKREDLKTEFNVVLNAMATPWVRVVTPMATPGGGTFFRPRIGDEVLVNFENDNVERPYVIGSVFSKNNTTPDEKLYRQRGTELQCKDVSMMLMSPNGHHITFTDPISGSNFLSNLVSPGLGLWGTIVGAPFTNLLPGAKDLAGGIHIGDRYGLYEIDMKSHKRSINIRSPFGTVGIDAFSGITISAPNGNVTIRGKNINLEAGNKVNITSGMNILDPGLGDPEGGGYQTGKIFTDLFAEIIPGELFKYMFASIVDLSYIRHIVEVFVRPVDGTLKLKSKRYLMLEAGNGHATIRRDRYAAAVEEKKKTSEEFYKALLTCVKLICEKMDSFYDTYETLWMDGYQKKEEYMKKAFLLKDKNKPNLAAIALNSKGWNDQKITAETYKGCWDIMMGGYAQYGRIEDRFKHVEKSAKAFAESAYKLYRLVDSIDEFLFDLAFLNQFDFIPPCFTKALVDLEEKSPWRTDWKQKFAEGHEDQLFNDFEPDPKTDKFAMASKTIYKRRLLLAFIYHVAKSPANTKHHYMECNYDLDHVLKSEFLRQEYYWNRTVFHLDRDRKLQKNNFGRKLWDNTLGMVGKKFKENFTPFDRSIWNDKADGQILFSEEESKTLNFQGEGLHEESSSNIGTLDHLKKELMAIK